MRIKGKIWLEDADGNYLMGPRTARLLLAIDASGKLSDAAQEAGFSYRAAWNRLKRVEASLGYPLVETTVGGSGGGSTCLSVQGRAVLEAFVNLEKQSKVWLERKAQQLNVHSIPSLSVKDDPA